MKIRFWLALWLGKAVSALLKKIGRKGTTLPGLLATKIDPRLIGRLAGSFAQGTVIITGTNGKTTTNNLFAAILRQAGIPVAFNREGANMLAGIAGALITYTRLNGKPKASVLLLEVDEATVPALLQQVTPKLAIVTNFFRDQLDRYGELDTTVKLVKSSLPQCTELILNGDDPLVAAMGVDREGVHYYGVERLPESKETSVETREGKYCSHCGHELAYDLFHYGQLGIYRCTQCGFERPLPEIEAHHVIQEEEGISFQLDEEFLVPLHGSYNLYNALAAISAARRLGVGWEPIREGLKSYISDAGRMEKMLLPEGLLTLTLVKNPTGFNQVLSAITVGNSPYRLLIAINDLAADGRDISWLWDVDFERLAVRQDQIQQIVCSGLRAEDMALRLKYAGIAPSKLEIHTSLNTALDRTLETMSGDSVNRTEGMERPARTYVLPTYTALFASRAFLLERQGTDQQRKVVVSA